MGGRGGGGDRGGHGGDLPGPRCGGSDTCEVGGRRVGPSSH